MVWSVPRPLNAHGDAEQPDAGRGRRAAPVGAERGPGRAAARGVRLPPPDPYLLGGRSLVVPDRGRQQQVLRAVANPGVVLADGWDCETSGSGALPVVGR